MLTSTFLLALAGLSFTIDAAPIDASPILSRGGSKRGLIFPKQLDGVPGSQNVRPFANSPKISWFCDWETVVDVAVGVDIAGVVDATLSRLSYLPMLHSAELVFTNSFSANVANAMKKYNVQYVLGINEPDILNGGGTNTDPNTAINAHRKYMQPLAGQGLHIGSPSVSNSGEPGKGIEWLQAFMSGCSGCQIDFVATHWYGWANPDDFKNYIEKFHNTFKKPVWITEFGVTSGNAADFLQAVLPWLDDQEWIQGYAYYMAAPSTDSQFLLTADGNALSAAGKVYATL